MALSKKPNKKAPRIEDVPDEKIDKFIKQGGSSYQEFPEVRPESEEDSIMRVQLRLYKSLVGEIDELLSELPKRKRPSRHDWLLDAIEEKLERDAAPK